MQVVQLLSDNPSIHYLQMQLQMSFPKADVFKATSTLSRQHLTLFSIFGWWCRAPLRFWTFSIIGKLDALENSTFRVLRIEEDEVALALLSLPYAFHRNLEASLAHSALHSSMNLSFMENATCCTLS